jgi:hypothetical protein
VEIRGGVVKFNQPEGIISICINIFISFAPLCSQRCRIGRNFYTCLTDIKPASFFPNNSYEIQNFYALTPKRVYVFVRISEQAGIISVHNINWLVLVLQTEGVYSAVRAQVKDKIVRPV